MTGSAAAVSEIHRDRFFRGLTPRAAGEPRPRPGGPELSIVRGIIEAHGGLVSVRNLDHGCRFDVRIPLAIG